MVIFRQAVFSDYEQIAALHAKSWQENYKLDFSANFLENKVVQDRLFAWKERLQNPIENQYILLAEKENVLMGFGCAFFDEHTKYGTLLDNLHVSHDAKRLGIGKSIIQMIARQSLVYKNQSGLYLWVLENNKSAFEFYKYLQGKHVETVVGNDIGDKEVRKCRIVWNSISELL
tara:strand:- start:9495 stop:10016 length:522 start_codon:yes stop_codon:yes gene_type:complete